MASLWHHYQAGGWAMWIILFWLICSIAVIAERAVYLFGSSINKEVFLATMQKCILAGDIAKAVKMCSAANAPLARIVQAGLVKVNRPDEEVQAAMDESALRELPKISALIGFAILNGKTQQIEDDINEASVQILNLVVSNRQKVNVSAVQAA